MVNLEDVVCSAPAEGGVFAPTVVFGRDAPLELEIGCGKGGFLLRRAQDHPELNLLGIEWANKYFKYAADRMVRWRVDNVRLMRTDANHFVRHHLPVACLSAIHVYHPDPWPKKRHHKRRLFQSAWIAAAARALAPGGRCAIQTDHSEYFDWIQAAFAANADFTEIPYDDPTFGIVNDSSQTNYEIKYRREGRTIYKLAFRRE